MAADWAFRGAPGILGDSSPLELAERLYVHGNIHADRELLSRLPPLPKSCVESSNILLEKRELYERDGIFPPNVIDYIARMLRAENDETMNQRLVDLPADDRLLETRKIMHKDLHTHQGARSLQVSRARARARARGQSTGFSARHFPFGSFRLS